MHGLNLKTTIPPSYFAASERRTLNKFCSSNKSLAREFFDKFPNKLPSEVSMQNLMRNWDKLEQSWNNNDYLGCLLPNDSSHMVIFNGRRFIQRPIDHWSEVHEQKGKKQKSDSLLFQMFS